MGIYTSSVRLTPATFPIIYEKSRKSVQAINLQGRFCAISYSTKKRAVFTALDEIQFMGKETIFVAKKSLPTIYLLQADSKLITTLSSRTARPSLKAGITISLSNVVESI